MYITRLHRTACTLGLGILLLASCSKSNSYEQAIPKDAGLVTAIHLDQLAQKAGLEDKARKAKIQQALEKGLVSPDTKPFLQSLLSEPQKLGIDLRSPIYFYHSPRAKAALLMRVSDRDDLEKQLKKLFSSAEFKQTEEQGYTLLSPKSGPEGQEIVAYDKKTLLIAVPEVGTQIKQLLQETMQPKKGQSFAETKSFEQLQQAKGDIRIYLDLKRLDESSRLPAYAPAEVSRLVCGMNFESGRLHITVQPVYRNKSEQQKIEDKMKLIYAQNITGSLDKYLPKSPDLVIGIHSNMAAAMKELALAPISNTEKTRMMMLLNSLISGEGVLAISELGSRNNAYAYAESTQPDAIDSLAKWIESEGLAAVESRGAHQYLIQHEGMTFDMGHRNGINYLISSARVGELLQPQAGRPTPVYAEQIKGKYAYIFFDLEQFIQRSFFTPLIQAMTKPAVYQRLQKLQYVLMVPDRTQSELTLQLSTKDNLLQFLVDTILDAL
nr:DUF4836 family protein [uncultured Porphyromonas sp.]